MKNFRILPLLLFFLISFSASAQKNKNKDSQPDGGNESKGISRANLILPYGFMRLNTLDSQERLHVGGNYFKKRTGRFQSIILYLSQFNDITSFSRSSGLRSWRRKPKIKFRYVK